MDIKNLVLPLSGKGFAAEKEGEMMTEYQDHLKSEGYVSSLNYVIFDIDGKNYQKAILIRR